MNIRKKVVKVAKGYRLRPETHKLINEMQMLLQVDKDTVITRACRMLCKEIKIKMGKKRL